MDNLAHDISVAFCSLVKQFIFDKKAFESESFDNLGFTFTFKMVSYEDEKYTYDVNVYQSGINLCGFQAIFGTNEKDELIDIDYRSSFIFNEE